MSLKKRVAWIDPSGKLHTILADDMDDATKQIAALRTELGFPQPGENIVQAAIELQPGGVGKAKGVVDVNDLPEETRKIFNEQLANSLSKLSKKGLD